MCDYLNRNWIYYEKALGRENVYYIYQLAMLTWYKTVFEQNKHHVRLFFFAFKSAFYFNRI